MKHFLSLSFCCLCFVFVNILNAQTDRASLVNIYEEDIISTRAIVYRHPLTQKNVHVVGIFHYGPKEYYIRIANYLKNLGQKVPILEEFTKCESVNTFVFELNRCDQKTLSNAWSSFSFPISIEEIMSMDKNDIITMEESGFLSPKKCQADPVSGIPRPQSILQRNINRCEYANNLGVVCQHDMYQTLRPSNLVPVHSDVVLSEKDTGEQLLASLSYSGLTGNSCTLNKVLENLSSIEKFGSDTSSLANVMNHFVLTHRDQILLNTLFKTLEIEKTVVTLWGAMHTIALDKKLIEEGFVLTSIKDITYMDKEDGQKYPELFQETIKNIDLNLYLNLK